MRFDLKKKGRIRLPLAVRILDPIEFYPHTNNPLIAREVERLLGTYKPMPGVEVGLDRMLTPPPEGVLRGENVPLENDNAEFEELYAKARERRIKSLERQEKIKKELEE